MDFYHGLKPTLMNRLVEPERKSVTQEELVGLMVEAWKCHPNWRLGELVANATRPGTGAPALRHIADDHLAELLIDVIEGNPPEGMVLS